MKKKKSTWGTEATETAPGRWEFRTGEWQWVWTGGIGVNLFLIHGGENHPVVYCKSLAEATLFAHGFDTGATVAKRLQE